MSDVLAVKPSTIPKAGNGLFALTAFCKDCLICEFWGKVLSLRELLKLDDRTYVIGLGMNIHIDAGPFPQVLARHINDNADKTKINVKFVKLKEQRKVLVVALRDIEAGEELFVEYGDVYWRARRGGLCAST